MILARKLKWAHGLCLEIVKFCVGQKACAQSSDTEEWYPGKIEAVHDGDMYDALFDDGDREENK
jgi:hypothetical protein